MVTHDDSTWPDVPAGWTCPASPEDLTHLYRAFLGREPEPDVLALPSLRPMQELAAEMASSEEINACVLHALVQNRPLPHLRLDDCQRAELDAWLTQRLGCPAASSLGPTPPPEPPEAAAPPASMLLSRLYAQPAIAEWLLLAHGSLFTQALDDLARLRRAGRLQLRGKIEFVNREHISGWALDESGTLDNLLLEIRLKTDGRLVATASAHSYRPDIHKRFGGSGLAGFRAQWDPRQFPLGQAVEFTLHEAGTGADIGLPYRFENSFVDQLKVVQMLAHEFESIQQRLDTLAGMVPQALSYCAFPLEHYRYYRRAHRVPPPPWLVAWQEQARLLRRRAIPLGRQADEPPLPQGPHFSVLLDATAPTATATGVRISADSLREQVAWPHWALQVVGDAGEIAEVAELLGTSEPRIGHLPHWGAAGDWLQGLAAGGPEGSWIVLLKAGELLDEHALPWLVQALNEEPASQVLYWDEDALRHRAGRAPGRAPEHVEPILRSPFDPHSMLELNVVGESFAARAQALAAAARLLQTAPTSPRYRAAAPHPLDAVERERLVWALNRQAEERPGALHHVPRFLLTRTEEAAESEEPPGAERLLARAEPEVLKALLPPAWQARSWSRVADPIAPTQRKRIVRWRPEHPRAVISVLIPTRDHGELVKQCVDSLRELAEHPDCLDIVVADNGSTDLATLDYLGQQATAQRLRVMRIDEPFNWSRLNNLMAQAARGEYLLFLNNDTRMLTRHWDSALRGELEHPDTGAVGVRLLYEDMTVQHAGVIVGFERFVGHADVGLPTTGAGELPLGPRSSRWISAATGAFLACRRTIFDRVGPFNEPDLGVTFNDVEWCLRLQDASLRVVYSPLITMVHYESKSRGFDFMSPAKQGRAEHERDRILQLRPLRDGSDPHRHPELSNWKSGSSALQ